LKDFHTTPANKKYGIDNTPTEDMRLRDEEIQSAVDYERESMAGGMKNLSIVKEEDEFTFENSRDISSTNGGSSLGSRNGSSPNKKNEFSSDEHNVRLLSLYDLIVYYIGNENVSLGCIQKGYYCQT
jgi:hypothetical protein